SFEDKTFRRNPSRHKISPFVSKEIPNILKELYKLFTRCEKQRVGFGMNLQIAYRNMNNKHSDRNLNCTKMKKNE
ncbi:MAG TPA: hypothetical protein QF625_04515, partial [Candidatus Scalindua sp.]|nr:hypothetical protein [Candidatus Scalindua sp.]